MCPIVEFIANHPGLASRLLSEHVDDGTGRCRTCSCGGQSGRQRWPCQIHDLAIRASEVERHCEVEGRRSTCHD